MQINIIEVEGWTSKNTTAIWDGNHVDTYTSFDGKDFHFENAEEARDKCQHWLNEQARLNDWVNIPVAHIATYEAVK